MDLTFEAATLLYGFAVIISHIPPGGRDYKRDELDFSADSYHISLLFCGFSWGLLKQYWPKDYGFVRRRFCSTQSILEFGLSMGAIARMCGVTWAISRPTLGLKLQTGCWGILHTIQKSDTHYKSIYIFGHETKCGFTKVIDTYLGRSGGTGLERTK